MARLSECSIEIAAHKKDYVTYTSFVSPHMPIGKALLRSLYERLPIKLASLADERAREEARQYYGLDADDDTAEIWRVAHEFGAVWYQKEQTGKPGLADLELRGKFENRLNVRKALESVMKRDDVPWYRGKWILKVCFEDFSFLFDHLILGFS